VVVVVALRDRTGTGLDFREPRPARYEVRRNRKRLDLLAYGESATKALADQSSEDAYMSQLIDPVSTADLDPFIDGSP
jgi:hypothetical protein